MGVRIENDCVGPCPMGCIHCGREHTPYYYCDECQYETDELYELDGEMLCEECFLEKFTSKICDDMDDSVCESCGEEYEELYEDEDGWLCEHCLLEKYRINLEDL